MKKRSIGIALAISLVLSVGVVAYAAADGFTMTYLPGTSDTVTDMPPTDSGTGGQPYAVSSIVPQREGYEFIDWTLDYGLAQTYTLTYQVAGDPNYGIPGDTATPGPVTGIREGSSVTLANALTTAWETSNGDPAPTETTYRVNYLEVGTDQVLCDPMVGYGTVGSTIAGYAEDIYGYILISDYMQSLMLKPNVEGKWTFTGWCSDEACTTPITGITNISADTTVYGKWVYSETCNYNEITFYYEEYVSYTVLYIDIYTGEMLIEPVVRVGIEPGTICSEHASSIPGYTPIVDKITFEVMGDEVIVFMYYEAYDPIF